MAIYADPRPDVSRPASRLVQNHVAIPTPQEIAASFVVITPSIPRPPGDPHDLAELSMPLADPPPGQEQSPEDDPEPARPKPEPHPSSAQELLDDGGSNPDPTHCIPLDAFDT